MKRLLRLFFALVIALVVGYFSGPKAATPELRPDISPLEIPIEQIEEYVQQKEGQYTNIRPRTEARIVWAKGVRQKTPYSMVYLHGFSATHAEGNPVHEKMAQQYGCNLYLSRLEGHGLEEEDAFLELTPEKLMDTAKEAIAIGKILGEKVIIMSCSTGSTLGLYLAAGNPDIAGVIAYSPNVDIYDTTSELLVQPWGLQIAQMVMGGTHRSYEAPDSMAYYWTYRYRIEGLVALKALVKATMTEEVFAKITQAVFVGYYYKNEEEQDKVISVSKALQMFEQLGTPAHLKRKVAFTDVNAHALCSKYRSEDMYTVEKETEAFLEEVMGLKKL